MNGEAFALSTSLFLFFLFLGRIISPSLFSLLEFFKKKKKTIIIKAKSVSILFLKMCVLFFLCIFFLFCNEFFLRVNPLRYCFIFL